MKYFPIFLKVEDKSLVIFGGGRDAAAKLRLLQKTSARVLVVADTLDHSVLDLGTATWIKASPQSFQLPLDTAFVYAATGDRALDHALAIQAQAQGILACAVDQADASDFITPALVDRDPLIVAIGTEGTAPVLARDLKSSLEQILEPSLGAVATSAEQLRPLVAKMIPAGGQRRGFWHDFFRSARAQPLRALEIGHALLSKLRPSRAQLSLIIAPHGRDGLDAGALKALHRADLVIFDPNISQSILELARREALHVTHGPLANDQAVKAWRKQQHVAVIKKQVEYDDLSEIAAGFGVLAQVFGAAQPQMPAQKPCPHLSQAA